MLLLPLHAAAPVWQARASMPIGLAGAAHAVIDGRLVVAGGTAWEGGVKTFSRAVWVYDPATNRWSAAGDLARPFAFGAWTTAAAPQRGGGLPSQRAVLRPVLPTSAPSDALWLFGGDDGSQTRADGLVWTMSSPPHPADAAGSHSSGAGITLPEPLAYCGSASDLRSIYILGGTADLHDLTQLRSTFFRIDRATGKRERLPEFPGGAVMHASLVVVNGDVLVFPGGTYDAAHHRAVNTRAAWRYDPHTRAWRRLADYPLSVRGLAACALTDSAVLLVGGDETPASGGPDRETAACWVYDVRADHYRQTPPLPYAAMLVGLERIGATVYAFAGEDRAQHRATTLCAADLRQLLK